MPFPSPWSLMRERNTSDRPWASCPICRSGRNIRPWVAAVWVEPGHRLNQVGRTLVGRTMQALFGLGYRRLYLSSSPERRDFYTRQGWVPIEENVGPNAQTVYACDTGDT